MKNKIAALYIIAIIAIVALPAQAAVVVTNINETEFSTIFSRQDSKTVNGSGAVWYTQAQPGGSTYEGEVGGTGNPTDFIETSWTNGSANHIVIQVDSANYLKMTINGVTAGDGYQVPIGQPFNEIWIGLRIATGLTSDIVSVSNQTVNGPASLPSLSVTGSTNGHPVFTGFKFYFDDRLSNIGAFTMSLDLNPQMYYGGTSLENWTYTTVGFYNTGIVPEPSTTGLLVVSILIIAMLWRYKQSSYSLAG
ncbi:MAG: hypothetical protein WCZ90_20190 [Melioribacteraceae bacterium]